MLKWCLKEARANNLKPDAYMGGFILDEMKRAFEECNPRGLFSEFYGILLYHNA